MSDTPIISNTKTGARNTAPPSSMQSMGTLSPRGMIKMRAEREATRKLTRRLAQRAPRAVRFFRAAPFSLLAKVRFLLAGAVFGFATVGAMAEIEVGDPAPGFEAGRWVQGEPITQFETNRVYILEFWATWSGLSVEAIPPLNDLARKFENKGVVVIGQDVWDHDDAVAPFVNKMGAGMTYRVALDDKSSETDGFMALNWWKQRVNHHSIPITFIVNKNGRIAWIGRPVDLNAQLIEDIRTDKFDIAQFAKKHKKQQQESEKLITLQTNLFTAIERKQWQEANLTLDDLVKTFPQLENKLVSTRFRILLGQQKFDEAWKLAETFSDVHQKDAVAQNDLAWAIVAIEPLEDRNLALAEKLAQRADQAASGTNADILDTLARAQFMRGKKLEAIETERRALKTASEEKRNSFEKALGIYQEGKLPEIKQ